MATIYLGIGLPKTGTTALQTFLRENEKVLESQRYVFPNLKLKIGERYRDRNGHFLIYKSEKGEREEAAVQARALQKIKDLAEKYDNIILSDEEIWRVSTNRTGFWKETIEKFEGIGCKLKVIVYLRRQDLLIQSLWNQNVKSRYIRRTESFEECISKNMFSYFPLDYYKYLNKITEDVAQEDLIVRVYEKEQFKGNGHTIFSDFLYGIGLEMTESYTTETVKSNLGLRGNFIEIKRIVNGVPEYQEMEDFMCVPMKFASNCVAEDKLHADTTMFKQGEQKKYLQQFEESNQKVAEQFLHREQLFYEPVEELSEWKVETESMYRDVVLLMTEVLCEQKKEIYKMQKEIKELKNSLIFRAYRGMRKKLKHGN